MSTLVIHSGGIGDFILTTPALAAFGQKEVIAVMGRLSRVSLATAMGVAEAVYDMDAAGFHTLLGTPSPHLMQCCAPHDRALVWMRDDDGRIAKGLRACGIKNVLCLPGLPPADWQQHASEYYCHCLGVPCGDVPRIAVPAAPGPDIVIHPGSGGARKNWPVEDFAAAARMLRKPGRRIGWCVGPAEEDIALPPGTHTIYRSSLLELAGVLASARLYIGNDSGITHLAAAAGCPTVAVFGPTEPAVWAPRGAHVRVVRADPWPVPEAVVDAARELLGARSA
ncbi:MAG: glycosyltransferase family 9 protein [Candidatus Hydrogenedentota bacterium]